ncbi:MAG: ComEC/Rec2 family competence protein [Proteobacteria bacterium]|nr:ComEC/Rec2 family competence protein [Pseudomonadota bacterium]MBS0573618.1 ComEC/Rec2 family competence protein [Pseudomonadota bacterium]
MPALPRGAGLAALLRGAAARLLWRLEARRGQLLPWAPVFLSLGIGAYFSLPAEPGPLVLAGLSLLGLALAAGSLRGPVPLRLPATGLGLAAGGVLLAAARAHLVAAPVLAYPAYGPVEGRIIDIDRSFSDQIRLTLDQVALPGITDTPIPARVRVALHGESRGDPADASTDDRATALPEPGSRVRLTARLAPPDGPVEPGGFDFQRLSWFSGLGAVGYSRDPVAVIAPPAGDLWLWAFRARMYLSAAMQAGMSPGQPAAFAAALMTGDRLGVSSATNQALRASNLSHIISISGLHMGLLSGFVFALCRYGLALVPPLALRLNTKKIAAGVALVAATFYMLLAGPDVATRRSYIMAAVILVAVLCDRRALSLRSVAIAALICLALEPESLVEPGFQMSFGATAALIVGFEHWGRHLRRLPGSLRPVAMSVLSSLVAGSATAPIAAAHFNRIAEYGLLANLLSIPVMGILVMPAGVMAAILAPFGMAAPALWVLERGSALILLIAAQVAALQGALVAVPSPPWAVLPLIGIGGAGLMLGGRWLRLAGAAGLAAALVLWAGVERPALLVSGDGTLAGLMTEGGRALSKERGAGFVAQNWLVADGDLAGQAAAFARPAFSGPPGAREAVVAGHRLRIFSGKGAAARAAGACTEGAILVLSERWPGPLKGQPCRILDRSWLRHYGSVALYAEADGLRLVTARALAGKRLWNQRPPRRPRPPDEVEDRLTRGR